MKLPRRFALSTLLLMLLVVALVFGYAQWRRQRLIQQVAKLQSSVYSDMDLVDHWFWPTVPSQVTVMLFEGQDGSFICPPPDFGMGNAALNDGKHYTREEAKRYFVVCRENLQAIGVQDVKYAFSSPILGRTFIKVND